jgi:hypothetical protein
MTIARTFFCGTYPFSHNHRFGVLIDFLQFLALENTSMNMRIKNIRIILERLQRITLILIFLIQSWYFEPCAIHHS